MGVSVLNLAGKRVSDVREFLRRAAAGNSLKYSAEKGAKHLLYFPPLETEEVDENGNVVKKSGINAYSFNVHEWNGPDGNYRSTLCIDGLVQKDEQGNMIYNGICPICERVSDGWEIYKYRVSMEEDKCLLTGEDRKKSLDATKSTIRDERKAKEAREYAYVLVVQYKQADGRVVMGKDSEDRDIPEYELKVMRMSVNRLEKLQQQIVNAGAELAGSEIIFEYPNTDDRRLQVSQSTTAPVFPGNKLVEKYPGLLEQIQKDVEQFDWESINKSFTELNTMTYDGMNTMMNEMFAKWDDYKQELKVNKAARYMEYVVDTPVTNPSLNGAPSMPQPNPAIPEAPAIPNSEQSFTVPDVNSVFGGDSTKITI